MKESDLFEPIKAWLELSGHEVFSEVSLNGYGGSRRADIVAIHGKVVTVIELKTSLSLDLIEQAFGWKRHAHRIFVGVPKPKRCLNEFACRLLRNEGIGILTVDMDIDGADRFGHWRDDAWTGVECKSHNAPKINRRISDLLTKVLTDEYKNGPPGGHAGGGYVTNYKLTMQRVREFMKYRRWLRIEDILEQVETHYSAPKQSLATALTTIETDWCERKKENGRIYFRYKKVDET